MTKNNLKLLDMDEPRREEIEHSLAHYIEAAKVLGLTLDAATSDNVLYVISEFNESLCIG